MKNILGVMLACAVCSPVYAKALAYIDSQAGTRIVITDQPGCHNKHMAYTTDSEGEVHEGCWVHNSKAVYIKWVDVPKVLPYKMSLWNRMGAL